MVLSEMRKMAIIMANTEYGFDKTTQRIGNDVLKGGLSEENFEKYFVEEGIINKARILSCPMRVKLMVVNQESDHNSRYTF